MKNKKLLSLAVSTLFLFSGIEVYSQANARMFGLAPPCQMSSATQLKQNPSVLNYNSRCFGYNAYPGGTITEGPFQFNLNSTTGFASLANQAGQNFPAGSGWANNKWYGVVYSDNELITIDTSSGVRTVIGSMVPTSGDVWTGMSYDKTASVMYAISVEPTGSQTTLYTVDLVTGAATMVGVAPGIACICLGANNAGQLFSVDILSDSLGTLSKTTGAWTSIGPIGFNAQYAQDMEFDLSTDTCFFACYNLTSGSAEMRTVDVFTGATTFIDAFPALTEVVGFVVPSVSDLGISQNYNSSLIRLYPNPVHKQFTIEISCNNMNEKSILVIYDVSGREVKRVSDIVKDIPLTISRKELEDGMYLYKVFSENRIAATGKIVLEN